MDFEMKDLPMISGQHEAVQRKYRKIECPRGVYLIALEDACADHVYYHNPKDTKSDGFGGATLQFQLEDGSVYSAKGPWKCAASYLRNDCGIDIEDKYSTFMVVGKGYRFEKGGRSVWGGKRFITDVIHQDEGWQIGRFDREIYFIADLSPGEYQYYVQTAGGSHSGRMTPEQAKERIAEQNAAHARKANSRFVVSAEQLGAI